MDLVTYFLLGFFIVTIVSSLFAIMNTLAERDTRRIMRRDTKDILGMEWEEYRKGLKKEIAEAESREKYRKNK